MGAMKAILMEAQETVMWHELEPHEKNLRGGLLLSEASKLVQNMIEMGWSKEKILEVIEKELELPLLASQKITGANDEP